MDLLSINHVSFSVDDIEKACEFYGGVPRLERMERPNLSIDGAWYRLGKFEIHIIVPPADQDVGSKPPKANGLANHVAFRVGDLERLKAELKSLSIPYTGSPNGLKQVFVQDPSGNVLEFNEG